MTFDVNKYAKYVNKYAIELQDKMQCYCILVFQTVVILEHKSMVNGLKKNNNMISLFKLNLTFMEALLQLKRI